MKIFKEILSLSVLLGLITNANIAYADMEGAESYAHEPTKKTSSSRRVKYADYADSDEFSEFGEETDSEDFLSEETIVETSEEYFEDKSQSGEVATAQDRQYVYGESDYDKSKMVTVDVADDDFADENFVVVEDDGEFSETPVVSQYQYAADIESDRYVLVKESALSRKLPRVKKVRNTPVEGEIIEFVEEKGSSKPVLSVDLRNIGVRFATNSDRLSNGAKSRVDKVAELLARYKNDWSSVALSGHTDIRGSRDYNRDLAKRRVKTVGRALLNNGVPVSRVKAKGYAFFRPLDDRNTNMAWFKNRRVEVKIQGLNRNSKLAKSLLEVLRR